MTKAIKVLAFGASNSRASINQTLASYAAHLLENAEVNLIDLNDFEAAIYSEDREKQSGIPEQAQRFYQLIGDADAVIISLAEHNGRIPQPTKTCLIGPLASICKCFKINQWCIWQPHLAQVERKAC